MVDHVFCADASPRRERVQQGDAQILRAAPEAAPLPPLSPSPPPALPTIDEEPSSLLGPNQDLAGPEPTEASDGERPASPPRARSKSATPALEAVQPNAEYARRQHRPSLAPLPTGHGENGHDTVQTSRSRSTSPAAVPLVAPVPERPVGAALGERVAFLAQNEAPPVGSSILATAASTNVHEPAPTLSSPTIPSAAAEGVTDSGGAVAAPSLAAESTAAPGKRRVPRASLAVTSRAAAAGPTRPAHLLPADHPAHPRPSLLASLSASSAPLAAPAGPAARPKPAAKVKGIPGPDEEARRRVREAKEARQKSARERKDKAERHAAALREEKRREKELEKAVALETAAAQAKATSAAFAESAKRTAQGEAHHLERPKGDEPRRLHSLDAPVQTVSHGAISSKAPLEPEVAGCALPAVSLSSTDRPTFAAIPTAPTSTAPTASIAPTASAEPIVLSDRALPLVIIETCDDSQHPNTATHPFDADMTLPDMGAPLDFGSSSTMQSQLVSGTQVSSATTSTPARHLKRKADSDGAPKPGVNDKTAGATAPSKRIRRPPVVGAQSQATSSKLSPAINPRQGVAERPVFESGAPPAGTSETGPMAAPKRRPSRLTVDDDCVERVDGSRHLGDQSIASQPGRARVVRVTLQVPAAPQAPPAQLPALPARMGEPADSTAEAKKRRRASRVTSPDAQPAVAKPASSPEPPPASVPDERPHHLLKHSRSVPVVSAPAPVIVELPARPRVKPALVIGGITLPASFTFAEPEEEDEVERARRLEEKERREQLAEAVLAEKKRMRESASAWAMRPDEATKVCHEPCDGLCAPSS